MRKILLCLAIGMCCFASSFAQKTEYSGAAVEDQSYLVLSTKKISTMEKELSAMAAKGFRVLYGAPTNQYDMALLLAKNEPNRGPYLYKILATSRISTMQKELNEAGREGYRILPRTIVFKQGFLTSELVMVVEKDTSAAATYEYDLVEATKEVKLHKKIEDAMARGFSPTTMIMLGEHVVVMEKANRRP
jgi:hypothetical protein